MGLARDARIALQVAAPRDLVRVLAQHSDYLCAEVLCVDLEFVEELAGAPWRIEGQEVVVRLLPQAL